MHRSCIYKKLLLFLCIFSIIASGCCVQAERRADYDFCGQASRSVLQVPKPHAPCPDLLDEGQWIENDDAASHAGINDKRSVFTRRSSMRFHLFYSLLTGPGVLNALFFAGMFHDSSCPTQGLRRIVLFILDADGQKDNFSFSFIS